MKCYVYSIASVIQLQVKPFLLYVSFNIVLFLQIITNQAFFSFMNFTVLCIFNSSVIYVVIFVCTNYVLQVMFHIYALSICYMALPVGNRHTE